MENYNRKITEEQLISILTDIYLGKIIRFTDEKNMQISQTVNKMLTNQIRMQPEYKDEYNKMFFIIENFYNLMSNPEVRKKIIDTKMNKSTFISVYHNDILGGTERIYNIHNLLNTDLIGEYKGSERKKIDYIQKNSVDNIYFYDKMEIIIRDIGMLNYDHWNGLKSTINEYEIIKKNTKGVKSYKVFSNILIYKMEEEDYKNAVLAYLLGEENVNVNSLKGYIGEIVKNNENNLDEIKLAHSYSFRIKNNLYIEYDATDLSAVYEFNKQKEEQKMNWER